MLICIFKLTQRAKQKWSCGLDGPLMAHCSGWYLRRPDKDAGHKCMDILTGNTISEIRIKITSQFKKKWQNMDKIRSEGSEISSRCCV